MKFRCRADSLVCRNFKPIRCTCLALPVLFIANWNSEISYGRLKSRSNPLRMYNLEKDYESFHLYKVGVLIINFR